MNAATKRTEKLLARAREHLSEMPTHPLAYRLIRDLASEVSRRSYENASLRRRLAGKRLEVDRLEGQRAT